MDKLNIKALIATLESRSRQERFLILAVIVALMIFVWLETVFDPMNADQLSLEQQITIVNSQVIEENSRYLEIQNTYTDDPNTFARNRQRELQMSTIELDDRLRQLYGQLILPRQMSIVLTTILQRETALKLVNLQNLKSQSLISASAGAATTLAGETVPGVETDGNSINGLQVYRHGLSLEFEGEYLETIRYLRQLESLETNFFWESLSFEVLEYPKARIRMSLFTLSTQEGFIGV